MPDTTDRASVEAALHDSEQRFRMLFERSAAAMNIADLSGRYLQVNQAYCDFLGFPSHELLQLSHTDVVHPDELDEVYANMAAGGAKDVVRRFIRKDGTIIWGYLSSIVVNPQSGPPYWVGVIQDITAPKKAEELLRESEERFRVIANDNPAYLWMTSHEQPGKSFINRALAAFLGVEKTELHRQIWADCMHPDDREWVQAFFLDKLSRGIEGSAEFRMQRYDGEYRIVISTACPRHSPSGELIGATGTITDITERKRAEEQILQLNERLINAHEEERSHIARELHDDLSQRIAAAAMLLSNIKRDLPHDDPTLQRKLEQAHTKLQDLAKTVRNISHQLHPATLEHAGLVPALRLHCTEFRALTGIEVQFHAEEPFEELCSAASLCLYRIAQEALQNVAKHAGIRSAGMSLTRNQSSVSLTIRDQGRGFDFKNPTGKPTGLGLLSMKERLRTLHGKLDVNSEPGRGTIVTATIPVTS